MRKIISILGSTGSIGQTALKIVDKKKNYFKIYLLSANKNLRLISQQIEKYKPNIFVVHNPEIFQKVKRKYKSKKIIILNNFKKFHTKKKNRYYRFVYTRYYRPIPNYSNDKI